MIQVMTVNGIFYNPGTNIAIVKKPFGKKKKVSLVNISISQYFVGSSRVEHYPDLVAKLAEFINPNA